MFDSLISTTNTLISTLGDIEVKGRENMDKLLGCILAVEEMRKALIAMAVQPTEKPETKETKPAKKD